ncbi:cache domain-containing protein, partial [Stenotrophomonas maltophilia group sp. RNC7]|uniref:cache domain-containing protein n=1 Tax=Stenotrophomonas maltophilia group sp. RNC7 TaxID=3071467 RepID=UPI0027E11F47
TVNMANSTKEIVKGLEEGANGYGFRVVVPVFYEGVHIGSVEYGSEFGKQFLQDIKDSYPGEYFIYSLKNIGDPNLDSGSNVIASTTEDVWRIEDEEYMKSLEKGETVYLTTQDQNYNVVLIPFKDFNGEIKGYYKVVNDRIETVDSINAIKRNSILITGALLLILVSIFYILLTRLLKPIGLLIDAIEEVAAGDLTKK